MNLSDAPPNSFYKILSPCESFFELLLTTLRFTMPPAKRPARFSSCSGCPAHRPT
jgi:hypothetical protein